MSFRPVNAPPRQATFRDDSASVPTFSRNRRDLISPETPGHPASYPLQKQFSSNSDSQATILSSDSAESSSVFTPINGAAANNGTASSGQGSSQESQLLQLSQLAAAQEKMPDVAPRSMKRNADGTLKDSEVSPDASPGRHSGHSRNMSAVSATSIASSRVTELSSELKTRLSYAMLKINNGWQSRTIDEVENLASRSGSPASSNSTIPGAARSSASPQIHSSHRPTTLNLNSAAATSHSQQAGGGWRGSPTNPESLPPGSQPSNGPSLAPPVSIQPHQTDINPRRNSNPNYAPAFLSPRPHIDSPNTPNIPSMNASPDNRNLRIAADPMVVSPAHDNREKDAMEALLFMRSPGNSANMKNHFPNAPLSVSGLRNGASTGPSVQRTALPTSAPKRKSLPNGRPTPSSQPVPASQSPKKRVGFGKSPSTISEMEVDDPTSPRRSTAYARAAAPTARKINGDSVPPGKYLMAPPSGRSKAHRPRPRVSAENLDDVLDRMAAETSSSDSDGEIELPGRREGPRMRA